MLLKGGTTKWNGSKARVAAGAAWVLLLALAAISEVQAQQTGTVTGTIKVGRAPAAPAAHQVDVSPEHCGATVANETLVVGAGGALANAVVWLDNVPGGSAGGQGTAAVSLDQRGCRFAPHVSTATVGQQLAVGSHDPIMHNVHAYNGSRTLFNLPIPTPGVSVRRPLSEAGRVDIKCDLHGWMSAVVYVFAHPYHAVTGRDGTFRIQGVPAGTYPVKVWHERLGERSGSVTVAGGSATVNLSF